jgi:hypothetical protein
LTFHNYADNLVISLALKRCSQKNRRLPMKKICPGIKRGAFAVLILIASLLDGCSYTAMPKNVPPITGYETRSLTGVSVIVTSAEKDSSEYEILTEGKDDSGFRANRQAWSKRLVEALARELARRGARVRSDAPVKLGLALPEITFIETDQLYQFKVAVVVSSSAEWSKTYAGIAETSRYRAVSMTTEADRMAGEALAEAVKAMLDDTEFLAHLGDSAPR